MLACGPREHDEKRSAMEKQRDLELQLRGAKVRFLVPAWCYFDLGPAFALRLTIIDGELAS